MASVSATGSIYSSIVAGNKGVGGLASGLDTDALMDSMTTATRQKIAKQQQNKQLAQWKQASYRSVITAMDAFRQKYLRFSSGEGNTNIASNAFFNSYKASTNGSAVKATTTTNSTLGDIEIEEVITLATNNIITGTDYGKQVLSSDVSLDTVVSGTPDFKGKVLSLTVDGTTKNIKLDSLNGLETSAAYVNELQDLIDDAFGVKTNGDKIVEVTTNTAGQLVLSNETGAVSIASDNALLGLTAGSSNRINVRTAKLGDVESLQGVLAGDNFKVNINGVELSFSGNDTIETILSKVNSSAANVRMAYSSITGNFEISSKVSGHANRIDMSDVQGNFLGALFGSAGGSVINASNFYTNEVIVANGSPSLLSEYDSQKGTAANRGKFMSTLDTLNFSMTIGDTTTKVTYNMPNSVRIKIAAGEDLTEAELLEGFNRGITAAFGDAAAGIKFALEDGKVGLTVSDTKKVSIAPGGEETDGLQRLGYTTGEALTNAIDFNNLPTGLTAAVTLSMFGVGAGTMTINTKTIDYTGATTLEELFNAINTAGETGGFSARFADGGLVIDGGDSLTISETVASGTGFLEKMYGIEGEHKSIAAASHEDLYDTRSRGGTNAEIKVNGQIISSTSNTFTLSGTEIEVLAATTEPTKISVTSEPEELVNKIKDFIADYNGLVSAITSIIKEKANEDAEYPPLSDEQKAEMTTEEIEKWEIEAKKGILRNDSTLNSILNQMRGILYESVGSSGISLYSIGITTVSYLTSADKSGHLEITSDNEEKLRQAIINNPDGVRELFTKAETGYAAKLDAAIDRAINTSSDPKKRGSLITLAGTPTLSANNSSSLDDKISSYDDRISALRIRLENEYDRYWKQFSALETAIASMSSQSSWLSSFVAS
jgi:flagellar capping protein FliD